MTVKIYRLTIWDGPCFCNHREALSLYPWAGDSNVMIGRDDGGIDYQVPDGFTVTDANDGRVHCYDHHGNCCELVDDVAPSLVSAAGIYPLEVA